MLERPTLLYAETEGLSGEALRAKLHAIAAENDKPLGFEPTKNTLTTPNLRLTTERREAVSGKFFCHKA